MNIDHAIDGEHARVTLAGDLDIYAAAELKERLVALCAERRELELDLAACGLIDTAGLQLLLAAKRALAANGGTLRLAAAAEGCRPTLELLELPEADGGAAAEGV